MGRVLMAFQSTFRPRQHQAASVRRPFRAVPAGKLAQNININRDRILDAEADAAVELFDYARSELESAAEARINFDE